MFIITTAGSDRFVACESRSVAVAKARYFSQKYGRTFTVKSVQMDTDPFGNAADPGYGPEDADLEALSLSRPCPKCGATGSDPCVTASGKKATKQHSGR